MREEEIIKAIRAKSQAIEENLLLTKELTEFKDRIEKFLDQNLQGDTMLALRYRKFKRSNEPRTLWSDTGCFPSGGENWIKPFIDFFERYIAEKTIKKRLEVENLWVESRTQGNEQHFLVGKKDAVGEKVHLIVGETGEIRIDKKDQSPSEILRKVQSVLTKPDGSVVKTTIEFFKEKI